MEAKNQTPIAKDSANDKTFPQFQLSEEVGAVAHSEESLLCGPDFGGGTKDGMERFRRDEAVQNRFAEVVEVEKTPIGVVIEATTSAKRSRLSWTHETSLYLFKEAQPEIERLYLAIEIWAEDVFRLRVSEKRQPEDPYAGLPEDARMLIGKPQTVSFSVEENNHEICLVTDAMKVCIEKANCTVSAFDKNGTLLYAQRKNEFKAADIFDCAITTLDHEKACFEAIELESDEVIYGLGERFDGIVRNGRIVDFHNKDAVGTTSRRTYVNIPFFISTKGYGAFVNTGAPINWEIGTKDMSVLQFSVLDDQLDYFVIAAKTPKAILKRYCELTGFSKLPPLWSFGLWMSRNSYTSWDVVDAIAKETREHDIPCDVLHLDTAWFNRDWNCDLKFSKERFPDPEKHMEKYKKEGFHVTLWQYNFIPPNDDNTHYHEAVENEYLAKNKDGKPYQLPDTCTGSWTKDVIVDFSKPEARAWYAEKIRSLIRMGAGAIKTDFGEGIPEDAYFDKIDGKYFHNLYSLVYNSTVFQASKDVSGENLVWARSGTAGSQRYPIHWGGDSQCTFEALAATLRAALSIGMSGIPFFSHDIGGFLGLPDDELYVRWAQLGLFSSHSRCHGVGDDTHREPWKFSQQACDIFRKYAKLRYSLMPYIYEQAKKSVQTGLPMMRALYLEYPKDRNTWHIEDEYLFGSQLLIAPVLKPLRKSNERKLYLPKGVWFDYFTKEKIESNGQWISKKVDLETLPIYVKQGTVLSYCGEERTLQNGMGPIVREEIWK